MRQNDRPPRMWDIYKKGGIGPAIASMFGVQSAQQMAFIRSVMKEQRKQPLFETPLAELELAVFDLETTGFSPYNGDEILSVGAVQVDGTLMKEKQFYSLVNPKRRVPKEITNLTGITNEMAAEAPELIDVLHRFLEFVDKRVLIAHGSGHDKHFLNAALWKTSRVNLSHRLIDTMMIGKWLYPKWKHYDLDSMLNHFGIEITERHHALEDSLMTARLWTALYEEISAKQVHTLGDLYAYLSRH
ncbi:exonuclease domain-containing protein [Paenibacillus turpanensis]|uniref:exonuclease domain-containing protein n=1 Tax=Paenibacillus turpanensis TaxID=2689078 RepID=UPI00140C85B5|nr:exonuclease domain-containing protein [Paenibacillus turpanensis]